METDHFDIDLFYEKTEGGLLFWEQEFATEKIRKTAKGFSFDNGSSNVTKTANGKYIYTNFKENSKGISVIDFVIKRDLTDFLGACNTLFAQFQLNTTSVAKPLYLPIKDWENTTELVGSYDIKYCNEIKNASNFAPFLKQNTCDEYSFYEIESYSSVKTIKETSKLSKLTVTATDNYPIFGYKAENFTKIYEPKALKNKDGYSSKHHFIGTKPPRHIYGWDRLLDFFPEKETKNKSKYKKTEDVNQDFLIIDISDNNIKDADKPFDYIFIATGGSDALNIASLGYDVIWFNSETEIINEFELNQLHQISKNIVYIPDLDKTGINQAVQMGLMSKSHLKIKMLFPPTELKDRGKKDIADWVRDHKNETLATVQYKFKELLSQAKEFEFWDFNEKRQTYAVNSGKLIQFLHYNGYYTYLIPQNDKKTKRAIEEKIFIKITNNIIEKVSASDVQIFVLEWQKKMFVPLSIQEVFYKSVFFNENNTIKSLPRTEVNTTKTTSKSQMYFYRNIILNIYEDRIEKLNYNNNNTQVWAKNIIDRNYFEKPKATKITKNEEGVFDIEILNNTSKYLKLLINTSRFYWKKDADELENDTNEFSITSKNLTNTENQHQKSELINKMYCLGYLLHEQKIKQNSFCVIGTDHKIGRDSKDNKGGSGKSAIISGLYSLIPNYLERNGRELNKDTERFKYTDVDDEVKLLHFDEMNPYFDLTKFFSDITADVTANWKGGKMVYIPFEFFTKIAITMNSVPQDITDSFTRRTLNFETSDFYHIKNEEYKLTRQISDSFNGQTLWSKDYSMEDWQYDDNFLIECLQFYLSNDKKIEFDGQNLMIRNYMQKIGVSSYKFLKQFFDDYFNPETGLAQTEDMQFTGSKSGINWINKGKIYEFYKDDLGKNAKTLQDFKDCLIWFFQITETKLEFAKQKKNGTGSLSEHFTIINPVATAVQQSNNEIETEGLPSDELPF